MVTETTHLLDFNVAVQTAFLTWALRAMSVVPVPHLSYKELSQWMLGYAKVPMDFADATVLWLYRATPDAQILTLDRRGFGVFRLPGQSKKRPAVVEIEPLNPA